MTFDMNWGDILKLALAGADVREQERIDAVLKVLPYHGYGHAGLEASKSSENSLGRVAKDYRHPLITGTQREGQEAAAS